MVIRVRYIFSLLIINVALVLSVVLKLSKNNDPEVTFLPEVEGLSLTDALEKLSDFETRINYLESETEKDVLLNTSPKGNSLVYYGQTIILNVSLGYESEKYRDLTNTLYNDNLEYIDYLKNEYQVRIVINYINTDQYLDGLIIKMNLTGEIKQNDELIIEVANNPKTIIMPDFIGCYYQEVLAFAQKHEIEVRFYFIEGFIESGFVLNQSIKQGTPILKKGCYLEIFLQE